MSHSNQIYVRFVSDYMLEYRGFKISWDSSTTGCGGILTSNSGSITSPNYPSPYGMNSECFWKIRGSVGSVLMLYFVDIQLEENGDCMLDYVQVFDGWDEHSPSLGKFCTGQGTLLQSSSNKLLVKFRSDISIEERGFHLQYNTSMLQINYGFKKMKYLCILNYFRVQQQIDWIQRSDRKSELSL